MTICLLKFLLILCLLFLDSWNCIFFADQSIHYAKLLRILWIRISIMQNCCGYYGSENPLCKTVADILDPRIHDAKLEKLFRILWISGSRTQNCCGYYGSADPGCKTVADIMDPRVQDVKLLRIFYGSTYPGCKTVADIMDPRIQAAKLLRILWIRVSRM